MKETIDKALVLLIIRLGAGGMLLTHGIPKINRLMADEIKFADPFGLGPEISLGLATFAEVICAILVMIGFKLRLATIPIMITMLTAAFYAHWDDPFSRKELPLMFFLTFLGLLVFGGGRFSLDSLTKKNKYNYN
ncbi:DoxX family protein [Algoriphagus sp. CAU 1675]|uniref:DoxX family protein n=1 Tax=Algoriphagus sp. CAU 1675 TaxID=3032597 RepID=UPI0023DA54B8|nr:DoxX family protein [Algoriphagus sp. CAU 1675]MDF2158865.1 DoxX family protein [Algoriphagus sp. CAU 1675]